MTNVSRMLFRNDTIKIKLVVPLINKDNENKYVNISNMNGNSFFQLNYKPVITFSYIDEDGTWQRTYDAHVDMDKKHVFNAVLTSFYDACLEDQDILLEPIGTDMAYDEKLAASKLRYVGLKNGEYITFVPCMVRDETNLIVWGVGIRINSSDNLCRLTFNEFFTMAHIVRHTDLELSGANLLNQYLLLKLNRSILYLLKAFKDMETAMYDEDEEIEIDEDVNIKPTNVFDANIRRNYRNV